MHRWLPALALTLSPAALCAQGFPELCRGPVAMAERLSGVPDRLMQAIAIVESGRRAPSGAVAAWPWTINVEGLGEWFDTKQKAIEAVRAHQARGARSIDVGCMQVNLMHHPDAFATLDDAFDPAINARWAARFLLQLLAQTGSWPRAVAGYHSLTPDIGAEYARKVLAVWAKPEMGQPAGPPGPQVASAAPSPSTALPAPQSSGGRLLPAPGGTAPQMVNRGLDSYRSMPTRLVSSTLPRRS